MHRNSVSMRFNQLKDKKCLTQTVHLKPGSLHSHFCCVYPSALAATGAEQANCCCCCCSTLSQPALPTLKTSKSQHLHSLRVCLLHQHQAERAAISSKHGYIRPFTQEYLVISSCPLSRGFCASVYQESWVSSQFLLVKLVQSDRNCRSTVPLQRGVSQQPAS